MSLNDNFDVAYDRLDSAEVPMADVECSSTSAPVPSSPNSLSPLELPAPDNLTGSDPNNVSPTTSLIPALRSSNSPRREGRDRRVTFSGKVRVAIVETRREHGNFMGEDIWGQPLMAPGEEDLTDLLTEPSHRPRRHGLLRGAVAPPPCLRSALIGGALLLILGLLVVMAVFVTKIGDHRAPHHPDVPAGSPVNASNSLLDIVSETGYS